MVGDKNSDLSFLHDDFIEDVNIVTMSVQRPMGIRPDVSGQMTWNKNDLSKQSVKGRGE